MKGYLPRIYLFIVLIVLIAIASLIFSRPPRQTNQDLIPLKIGYNVENLNNASLIIALEEEYLQKRGISPQIVPLKSGREVMQALAANQIDIGIGGFINFMPAIAKGAPIKVLTTIVSSPSFLFVRPDNGLQNFNDLLGKRVALTVGGTNDLFFRLALSRENIDSSQIEFVDIDKSFLATALVTKEAVEAVVASEQDMALIIKSGAIIFPAWTAKGYGHEVQPRNSIMVNTAWLDNHEEIIENFLAALSDAHRLLVANPLSAAEIVAKNIKTNSDGAIIHDPENIVKQWQNREMVNTIWQDPSLLMQLVDKASEMGIVTKKLNMTDVYDLRFNAKLIKDQQEIYGQTP
jgi:ABC-type nitrate/sulfonate/bicarbonate transport system substrate-binding protein